MRRLTKQVWRLVAVVWIVGLLAMAFSISHDLRELGAKVDQIALDISNLEQP
jgi:hypothetical protein